MSQFDEFDQQGTTPERNSGSIISHAFEMYKGIFVYVLVAVIINIVLDTLLQLISGFGFWMNNTMDWSTFRNSDSRVWQQEGSGIYYSSSTLVSILLTPLHLGLLYIANKYNNKETIEIADLFIGFRQNVGQTLLYGLISSIILGISALMCGLPVFFVFPLLILGMPFLLFENLSAVDALSKSFNITKENYGVFLGTGILGILIAISGIILCCIGIVFTMPFIYVMMYSAYCAYCGKPRQIYK